MFPFSSKVKKFTPSYFYGSLRSKNSLCSEVWSVSQPLVYLSAYGSPTCFELYGILLFLSNLSSAFHYIFLAFAIRFWIFSFELRSLSCSVYFFGSQGLWGGLAESSYFRMMMNDQILLHEKLLHGKLGNIDGWACL